MEELKLRAMRIVCYIPSVNFEFFTTDLNDEDLITFALGTVFKEYFNGFPREEEVKIRINPKYFAQLYSDGFIKKHSLERSQEDIFKFKGVLAEPSNLVCGAIISNNDPAIEIDDPEFESRQLFMRSLNKYNVGDKVHVSINENLQGTGSIDKIYWVQDLFISKEPGSISPQDFTWGYKILWNEDFKHRSTKVFIPERMIQLL